MNDYKGNGNLVLQYHFLYKGPKSLIHIPFKIEQVPNKHFFNIFAVFDEDFSSENLGYTLQSLHARSTNQVFALQFCVKSLACSDQNRSLRKVQSRVWEAGGKFKALGEQNGMKNKMTLVVVDEHLFMNHFILSENWEESQLTWDL